MSIAKLFLLCGVLSALVASIVVRYAAFWSVVPDSVLLWVHQTFTPTSQERVADIQWLAIWGFFFLVSSGIALLLHTCASYWWRGAKNV